MATFTLTKPELLTPQVTPQVEHFVTVIQGEMSRQQLMALLNLKDRKHFTENYLRPALVSGLIALTIPDKPTSRLQKYRLTASGQALVNSQQVRSK